MLPFYERNLRKILTLIALLVVGVLPLQSNAQFPPTFPLPPSLCPKNLEQPNIPGIPGLLTCPSTLSEKLPSFNIDVRQSSVSGLSSGGFMAVQLHMAFSSIMKGAGIIAGGPYFCSRGDTTIATTKCSCTGLGACQVAPGGTNVPELIRITNDTARQGLIDAVSNLSGQRVWLFSGTRDTVVPQPVMNDLKTYYQHFIGDGVNIKFVNNVAAEHAMPTDFFGNSCPTKGSPFINNCNFDAAGELLKFIYGDLKPRNNGTLTGRIIKFDQSEFIADHNPTAHGMAQNGYLYVPASCDKNSNQQCRLHVAFHGCQQDPDTLNPDDTYVQKTGYNKWADTNNIIVLYPQAAKLVNANPNACWNFWNFERNDANFATKIGRQMATVKGMIDRIAGSN